MIEIDSNLTQLMKLLLNQQEETRIKYITPTIQNELIGIMGHQVYRIILQRIKAARYFCIMADETSDVSNQEQMCLVIR